MPFNCGPRHCGQFSAEGTAAAGSSMAIAMQITVFFAPTYFRWSASLSPSARWKSGERRGLAGAPEAAGERRRLG